MSGEDSFGSFSYDRLTGTQGKDFRKEKHKLKNKSTFMGELTMKDNTLPFPF